MAMPWTCDALLPQAERYSSLKFRRFARVFHATRLDYGDAVELLAFHKTLGVQAPRILEWHNVAREQYAVLDNHMGTDVDVVQAVEENRAAYSRDEGLRVLAVMRECGWKAGWCPEIVRFALLDMRDAGFSQPKIAELLDLTLDQVRWMANGARRVRPAVPLSRAGLFANA